MSSPAFSIPAEDNLIKVVSCLLDAPSRTFGLALVFALSLAGLILSIGLALCGLDIAVSM
jgi:hypothetical protein